MAEDKKNLRCSFCGKREEEVRRMIQGPGARICDQCVQLCMSVLEEELGAPLFVRGKRRLQLTEEGAALLRRANELLDLAEKARQEIREMKNGIAGTLDPVSYTHLTLPTT